MTRRPRIRINPVVTDADEQRVVARIASTMAARHTESIDASEPAQPVETPTKDRETPQQGHRIAPPATKPVLVKSPKVSFHVCVDAGFDARVTSLAAQQGLSLAYIRKALAKRAKVSPGFQNPRAVAREFRKAVQTPPLDHVKWFSTSMTVSDTLLATLREIAGDPLNILPPATLARAFLAVLIEAQDLGTLFAQARAGD